MADQVEVVSFLSGAALWDGRQPERIDTHISSVFVGDDLVLKLKKAVRLPFLDFTEVEERRRACEAEVEVNRRAAPDLYLGVSAITREPDGRLTLDGAGAAVDWVVRMRRFASDTLFSRLAETGRLDRKLIQDVVEAVARFHQTAPVRRDRGGRAGLAWTIDSNRASMEAHAILPPERVASLAAHSLRWLDHLTPLLEQRRERGMVRQCHGDLHLGNLCLFQGKPTLFDAIEFSEDIACIDTAYDLAFLLMDLELRGHRGLASVAMNHALDVTGDYESQAALPLFLSLRAGVRAHVSATMGLDAAALRYLDAALAYLSPPAPSLLAVGGLSGSGKSRMGRELAPLLAVPGAAIVRTDALRKQIMGVSIHDRLGPEGYTPEMNARTYGAMLDTVAPLLSAGRAVIADAVFAREAERDAIEHVAVERGVPFHGLWLEADPEVARHRVRTRKANVSDATADVLEQQLSYDLGAMRWARIDTSGSKADALAAGRRILGL